MKQRRVRTCAQMPTFELFTILLALLLLSQATLNAADWVIDGNRVYWQANGYLISCTPAHGGSPTGKIEVICDANATNPATLTANFSFVFPTQIVSGDAYLWQNISHDVQIPTIGRRNFTTNAIVLGFTPAPQATYCDVGDLDNPQKYNVSTSNGTKIYCFVSTTNVSNNYTVNYQLNGIVGYSTQQQYWYDWNDITALFSHTQYQGKDIFTVRNVQFPANYRVKLIYQVPKGTSGKFDIYAHTGSPQDVISGQGQVLLRLDPWWNTTCSRMNEIPITYTSSTLASLINYTYPIRLNNTLNWAVLNSTNYFFVMNNSTVLYFLPDTFNATTNTSVNWVNINLTNNTNTVVDVYYGCGADNSPYNAIAGSNNGSLVWKDFYFNASNYALTTTASATGFFQTPFSASCSASNVFIRNDTTYPYYLGCPDGSDSYWAAITTGSMRVYDGSYYEETYSKNFGRINTEMTFSAGAGGGDIRMQTQFSSPDFYFYDGAWGANHTLVSPSTVPVNRLMVIDNTSGATQSYYGYFNTTYYVGLTPTMQQLGNTYNPAILPRTAAQLNLQPSNTANNAERTYWFRGRPIIYPEPTMSIGATQLSINVSFINQSPNDINTTNIIYGVNITYNITGASLNTSTAQLFTQVNSSAIDTCWLFVNGTATCGFQPDGTANITGDTYFWAAEHDYITPTVSPLMHDTFERGTHSSNLLSSNNDAVKILLKNVSNATSFNEIMVMLNSTSNASLSSRIYYCNSSYTNGDFTTSPFCTQIADFNATTTFLLTENQSKYNVISVAGNNTSGTFGGIKTTPLSYFIIRGRNGAGNEWAWGSVPNISTTNTTQTTSNSGVVWSNFAGTIDFHLHQYLPSQTVCYYASINDTTGANGISTTRCDLIEQANMPPSSPNVFSPTNTSYYKDIGQTIPINWTASVSPNLYPIVNYTLNLQYASNDSFVQQITILNGSTLGYDWNAGAIPDGQYNIHVIAKDSLNQTSFGESEDFTLISTPNETNVSMTSPNNGQYYLLNATINLTFNATNFANCTVLINGTNFTMTNISATQCQYNLTNAIGNYTVQGYVNDLAGHSVNTSNLTFFIFNITSATTNFSNPEYDLVPDNITLTVITDNYYGNMSGNLSYNGTLSSLTVAQNGNTFVLSKLQTPADVSATTNISLSWAYIFSNAILNFTTNNQTNVSNSGLFPCGNTTNTTSINISYFDQQTTLPVLVNDSLQISYVDFTGRGSVLNATNSSIHAICVFPPSLNISISLFLTADSPGYFQKTTTLTLQASNLTQNISIFLISTATSQIYTFQTINQYNAPVPNSTITAERLNQITNEYVVVESGITDATGSISFPLQQFISYRINITSTGFKNVSFLFTPALITTIQIKLSTPESAISIPNLSAVFNNVSYSITPTTYFHTNATPIVFSVFTNSSNLESFGMFIIRQFNNTNTTVFDQASTNSSGGEYTFVATDIGLYIPQVWFKVAGYANYTPAPYPIYIGNNTGAAQTEDALRNGDVMSGWAYFFLFMVLSLCAGGFATRFTPDGGVFAAIIVMLVGIILAPDLTVINVFGTPITVLFAGMISIITGISIFYTSRYGG